MFALLALRGEPISIKACFDYWTSQANCVESKVNTEYDADFRGITLTYCMCIAC